MRAPRNAVAKLFWQKTQHPLAMAMLGSFVCKYVGRRVRLLRFLRLLRLYASSTFSIDKPPALHLLRRST